MTGGMRSAATPPTKPATRENTLRVGFVIVIGALTQVLAVMCGVLS